MARIAVGSEIPDGALFYADEENEIQRVSIHSSGAGKKVVFFGVPGAFTPVCRRFESEDDLLFLRIKALNGERSLLAQSFEFNYGDFIPVLRPFLRGYLKICKEVKERRLLLFKDHFIDERKMLFGRGYSGRFALPITPEEAGSLRVSEEASSGKLEICQTDLLDHCSVFGNINGGSGAFHVPAPCDHLDGLQEYPICVAYGGSTNHSPSFRSDKDLPDLAP